MQSEISTQVLDALARRRSGSSSAAALRELMAAVEQGAADEVARRSRGFPERERLVVVVLGSLLHPEAFREAIITADQELPRGKALAWTWFLDRQLASAWAVAMAPHVSPAVIAGLLARDASGARALLPAVRDHASRGELQPARVLYEAMSWHVKGAKAAARAAIALSPATLVLGDGAVLRELEAALEDAVLPPLLGSGGDEVAALGELLSVLIDSGVMEPEHAAIERLQQRLHALRAAHRGHKDDKSPEYLRACARPQLPPASIARAG